MRAHITATGMAVPDRVVTNNDLEKMVDTSDQWIRDRTGMVERRVSDDKTAASDLAVAASKQAIQNAGLTPKDIDAILVATISGDYPWPATACIVQSKLGANPVMSYDLSAACTGFLYGLSQASAFIETEKFKNILLIGVDLLTKTVDWTDRNTCVLFGDGAGAAIIQPNLNGAGVIDTMLGADGSAAEMLYQAVGGSRHPMTEDAIKEGKHYLYMNGREIFKQAVRVMAQTILALLEKHGKTGDDIALVVPHQANIRILEAVSDRIGVGMDRFFLNINKYGNTSAATIPMATHEARQEGRLKDGDLVVMVSFGGGLTWGASLVQF
ncbi:MAG: beta-ketoacyl-ACP synthase III [Candidatus Hinthialibacter antarcticus]|nr:beta-ketoacyl-ACP synthase III [Candidatus Hinthialibacter antarcticus]